MEVVLYPTIQETLELHEQLIKRVAFATTAIFLRMNGYRLEVDPETGESFLIGEVIQKKILIEDIATWLETYMREV